MSNSQRYRSETFAKDFYISKRLCFNLGSMKISMYRVLPLFIKDLCRSNYLWSCALNQQFKARNH